jgi:hypothetical protein
MKKLEVIASKQNVPLSEERRSVAHQPARQYFVAPDGTVSFRPVLANDVDKRYSQR